MEAGMNLLSSSPPFLTKAQSRNSVATAAAAYSSSSSSSSSSYSLHSSSSVLMLHEQASPSVVYVPTNFTTRRFSTSVLLQEQRDDCKSVLQLTKDNRTSQATLDGRQLEAAGALAQEDKNCRDSDQYLKDFERQLLRWPGTSYLLPPVQAEENFSSSLTQRSVTPNTKTVVGAEAFDALALAKKALLASREAASFAEESKLFDANVDDSLSHVLESTSSTSLPLQGDKTVRSTRLLERRLKKRRVPKSTVITNDNNSFRKAEIKRKVSEGGDQSDPLRLFLWGPETKKLLTAEEESELVVHIKDLLKLEEVKNRLQTQFNRELTMVEWAEVVGLSCHDLQIKIRSGARSREKLIHANLRMVVHIAKQYLGRGLSLQDLLQEGSLGLMKSVEKFKPQAGCRFSSYAYWWIRQAIRKAIFHHSRTIRLPDNVYALLGKVLEAKKLCIQEGHRRPSKEELSQRVGISVDKLESLLFNARFPLSIQQPVWTDQDTTFQEITADTQIERPDVSVEKQVMRQHMRNLLNILSPREKHIIRLRYGISGSKRKSLSDIGLIYGLSKERVRQLESRALYRLKQCLDEHGLDAYANLLI